MSFEYEGRDRKGIVFVAPNYGNKFAVANSCAGWSSNWELYAPLRKIGHTHEMDGSVDPSKAMKIAKAYFAQPHFTGKENYDY